MMVASGNNGKWPEGHGRSVFYNPSTMLPIPQELDEKWGGARQIKPCLLTALTVPFNTFIQ